MIFVTVGMSHLPFDRLVAGVEGLTNLDDVIVQTGSSHVRPRSATCFDYLSFDRITDCLDEARVVVTHGGIGSVVLALRRGRRPIVLPRRKRYSESVDDHQVSFAARLADHGLVTLVDDADGLRHAVVHHGDGAFVRPLRETPTLALDIRAHLREVIRDRPR